MFRFVSQGRPVLLAAAALFAPAAGAVCVVSAGALVFGELQAIGTGSRESSGFATLTVACTALASTTSYTIGLGPSIGETGTSTRYLRNALGGPPLAYNLYLDAAYTTIWGDGISAPAASGTLAPSPLTLQRQHTVYARTAAVQPQLRPGAFVDQILVTVTYSP